MKKTIKILMIALCSIILYNNMANAGNDKPIPTNMLPMKAQALLSSHFSRQRVVLATRESGIVGKSYDVVLQNGTKLEFDKRGYLTEIECKRGAVPAKLIPQRIKNFIYSNYPEERVKKMELDKNKYEVELSNGIELTFNKHFKLIDID